jgi:hypothetical protein
MSSCIIRADTVIDALQACVSDAWWWCGLPGNSLKMGCCWVPSSAHPYCYKKNPNPPPPAPSDHDTQWPTDDGGKTVCFRHLCINAINLPRQARDKHRENSKTDRFFREYPEATSKRQHHADRFEPAGMEPHNHPELPRLFHNTRSENASFVPCLM